MNGVLIFTESEAGQVPPGFWEQVTLGRQLAAGLEGPLQVVVHGWELDPKETARRAGAEQVFLVEDPALVKPWPEAHLAALAPLCRELRPAAIVMPRTLLGTEVGTRLAFRLGGWLAQDVIGVELVEGTLVATRPVFGGAAVATIKLSQQPWVVVPRPGAFAPTEPAAQPSGELTVAHPALATADFKTSCGKRTREQSAAQQLERARTIIAGGRGLGGPEPFKLLGEIAELLGAVVGASRPPCDAGWMPSDLQIGLTGKMIAPDLYIAVGISGAIQHVSGCSSSRVIVAVNSDPEAPIFRAATYGAVGKWQEILPAFRDALAGPDVKIADSR